MFSQVWFAAGQTGGGSADVLARIDAYMPTASFVSRTCGRSRQQLVDGSGSLLLEYSPTVSIDAQPTMRQTLNPDLLAELVRGALLSLKDLSNTSSQSAALEGFVNAFHAASAVHMQRLHLEAIGHPDFCDGLEEKLPPGATVRLRLKCN